VAPGQDGRLGAMVASPGNQALGGGHHRSGWPLPVRCYGSWPHGLSVAGRRNRTWWQAWPWPLGRASGRIRALPGASPGASRPGPGATLRCSVHTLATRRAATLPGGTGGCKKAVHTDGGELRREPLQARSGA